MHEQINVYGGLWYLPDINRFTDVDGNVLHNLSPLFPMWQIEAWKRYCEENEQDYQRIMDQKGRPVELFYLGEGGDEETYEEIRAHVGFYPSDSYYY